MMRKIVRHIWLGSREVLTTSVVAGIIVAATGVTPDHLMASMVHQLRIPPDILHLWSTKIDLRWVLLGAGLTLVVGDVAWRRTRPPVVSEAGPVAAAPTLPGKPSIAVLAFTNMSGDPEQEYFSDGIAEDITTALSHVHWLFVIARNSSFTFKGHAADIKQVSRELGVRYVLEGSVRRAGDQLRVTAQLIDASSGANVWAERFDETIANIFAIQDGITLAVVNAIAPVIQHSEQTRALRKKTEFLDAWEALYRGQWHYVMNTREGNESAREFFKQAIKLDAGFAAAYVALAWTYADDATIFLTRSLAETAQLCEPLVARAFALDPQNEDVQVAIGFTRFGNGDLAAAQILAERALERNPNCVGAYRLKGIAMVFSGQLDEGRRVLEAALRLNPNDPRNSWTLNHLAVAAYLREDYKEAADLCRRALRMSNKENGAYRWLVAALGQLGELVEARQVIDAVTKAFAPVSFDEYATRRLPWAREQDQLHMLEGLRKARGEA